MIRITSWSKHYYQSRQQLWRRLTPQPLSPFVTARFSSSVCDTPSSTLNARTTNNNNTLAPSQSSSSSSSSWLLTSRVVHGNKRTLQLPFDHHFKRRISSSNSTCGPPPLRGLFSIPSLQTPSDFAKQASLAMQQCDALRASLEEKASSSLFKCSSNSSKEEARLVLYQLDEISRIVCNVIDAAELCRSVHVDEAWRDAASRAFATMSDYIAQLNADPCLYQALQQVLTLAGAASSISNQNGSSTGIQLTQEERRLAQQLLLEFERDGIHLPHQERQEVRQLQNQIVELETLFSRNLVTWQRNFGASAQDVQAVLPLHVLPAFGISTSTSSSTSKNYSKDNLTLTSDAQLLQTLLKYSTSPSLRKQVYMEYTTAVPENIIILEALRQRRHELARKCSNTSFRKHQDSNNGGGRDWESYAERFVSNQMAQSPANVQAFLHKTAQNLQPALQQELQILSQAKQACEGNSTLEAWDVTHYTGLLKSRRGGNAQFDSNEIACYLSLTQCLASMKQLCLLLFGIDMQEEAMTNQERWDGIETTTLHVDDATLIAQEYVRRFVLTDTNHGRRRPLGTLYLDLHPRPGKYGHAAHFTVRCGCRVRPPNHNDNVNDANDADGYDSDDYQLPVVALVCNLTCAGGGDGDNNDTLSHGEVETLFHEFGHALHSLLSRTSFQHMSGTRGAMDFVEMPSHLIEHYVWDFNFLKHHLTAHPTTGQAMPDDLIQKLQQSRHDFHAIERQTQILYATLDQRLFGVPNPDASMNHSTAIFAHLHKEFNLPYAPGTHWHSRFGHLVTYGAGYYSYLYAQVLASDVWKHLFGKDSLDKKAGHELWHKVLIHGGAKDPTRLLKDLLGRPPPSFGDQ